MAFSLILKAGYNLPMDVSIEMSMTYQTPNLVTVHKHLKYVTALWQKSEFSYTYSVLTISRNFCQKILIMECE